MSLYFRTQNKFILVTGSTYSHRGRLKELGASFVPDRKAWRLPLSDEVYEQVEKLCEDLGGGSLDINSKGEEELPLSLAPKLPLAQEKKPKEPEASPGISIFQLYQKVEGALLRSFPQAFWLIGEIESIAHRAQGTYITLAEKEGIGQSLSVNALLWKNTLKDLARKHSKETLKDLLQEGLKLCVLCRLGLYKGRGSLSLTVVDVNPSYTKGLLALEREKTVGRLKSLGLYGENKKRLLLRFPFRIGLITAEGSRAYSDFCHQLTAHKVPAQVFFAPATMQGTGAFPSLKGAFWTLQQKKCDIIILTRGGGSASDLRVFDDFNVASLVSQCPVPVIAAIGHHEDSPVCEEVCFRAAKTPTAAAEFILRHFEQGASYLDELALQMTKSLERASELSEKKYEVFRLHLTDALKDSCARSELLLTEKRHRLGQTSLTSLAQKDRLTLQLSSGLEASFQKMMASCKEKMTLLVSRLGAGSSQSFSVINLKLEAFSSKVLSFDPRPWLHKGWTRLYRRDGTLVRALNSIASGDEVEAHFLDGKASLEVTKTEKKEKLS